MFCSMLIILGLFTRFAALIIVISLSVAVFVYPHSMSLKNMETGVLYLTSVFSVMILGPGRISVDGMMGK